MKEKYIYWEKKVSRFFRKHGLKFLSITMGVVYIWFGVLKVIDMSPVEDLVERSTAWLKIHEFDIYVGAWEVVIGLCFLFRRLWRIGLWLYFLHIPGVFFPVFLFPNEVFKVFPFVLTIEGQYIFKNIVFLAASFVLIGGLHPDDRPEIHEQSPH